MGLQEQLDSFRAEFARTAPSGRVALYEAWIDELRASFAMEKAVGTGDEAPDFSLPDVHGNRVSLSGLLQHGPVVVTFYRGGWCPYCNIQLRAYQATLPELAALGARLVAISPQLPDGSLTTAQTNALTFDVLSDGGNSVARRFGLVYSLPEDLREALRSNDKALPAMNGDGSWELPVPATYVIAPGGRVVLAGIEVDYRKRLEPDAILAALKALLPASSMASGKVSVDPGQAQRIALHVRLAEFTWAALTVMIFSGWFVVTRLGVTRELRIWDIAALRFGIGVILLAPAVVRRGPRLSAAAWGEGLIFAVLWGVPFVLLVALGLKLTSAAQAASVAPTLMPVFAGLFGWGFLRERQGRSRWIGYAAIIAGLVCLVGAGVAAHGKPNPFGIFALTAAAAMWAIYTLLFRRSGLTPVQSAALICLWSTAAYLPVYLFLGLSRFSLASPGEIALQAFYQGVLMSGVALITYNRAVSLLDSSSCHRSHCAASCCCLGSRHARSRRNAVADGRCGDRHHRSRCAARFQACARARCSGPACVNPFANPKVMP